MLRSFVKSHYTQRSSLFHPRRQMSVFRTRGDFPPLEGGEVGAAPNDKARPRMHSPLQSCAYQESATLCAWFVALATAAATSPGRSASRRRGAPSFSLCRSRTNFAARIPFTTVQNDRYRGAKSYRALSAPEFPPP